MEVYPLFLKDIRVPDNHREPDESIVNGLVKSFKEIGHQIPITFYEDDEGPVLIAGRNRLEAARRLDWDSIDAVEMEVDETLREIWRIDENLMRAELTAIERAGHIARRAKLLKNQAETIKAQNEPKLPGRPSKGQVAVVEETAKLTGKSKASVKRDKRRGEKIIPEVKEQIKDMPAADKGVELDAIADLKPEEQEQAVEQVQSGVVKDFREAKEAIKGMPKKVATTSDIEFGRLKLVWRRAGVRARKRFMKWAKEQLEGKAAGE